MLGLSRDAAIQIPWFRTRKSHTGDRPLPKAVPEDSGNRRSRLQSKCCRALGALLRHSLGGSDGQVQTQGVSESAAVAAGRDRLRRPGVAWRKSGTGTQAASDLVQE